jgi:hypothetical protein
VQLLRIACSMRTQRAPVRNELGRIVGLLRIACSMRM